MEETLGSTVLERRTERNRKPSPAWDGSWADLGLEGSRLSQRPLMLCLTWEPCPEAQFSPVLEAVLSMAWSTWAGIQSALLRTIC